MDLRKKFSMALTEKISKERIIVVYIGERTIGFKVDGVSEVLRLPVNTVDPPPSVDNNVDSQYMMGVGKLDDRLLILLGVEKILNKEEMEAMEAVA